MMRFTSLLVFSIALLSGTWALPSREQKAVFDSMVKEYSSHYKIPCFVSGYVIHDGADSERFYESAGGESDIENHVTCRADTMMRVASVSKSMESILTGKYVENGTLSWDDDIHKWIPEQFFPKKQWNGQDVKITLRQLLMHQSGIRGSKGADFSHYWETRILNTTGTLQMFAEEPLAAEPGHQYIYSNNGINLIAAIIENHQGQSYHLLAKEFFRTLGLKLAQMDNPQELIPHRAGQYGRHEDKKTGGVTITKAPIDDNLRPFPHWPAGGVITTVEDLNIFAQAVLDIYHGKSSFLKAETLKEMWNHKTPVSSNKASFRVGGHTIKNIEEHYVMGWARFDFPVNTEVPELSGQTMFLHTGAVGSASAVMAIFPEAKFAFTAIANVGGVSGHLPQLAVEAFYALHHQAPHVEGSTPKPFKWKVSLSQKFD